VTWKISTVTQKNFFAVNMASKKSATMTGNTVQITSIVESTIDIKEFSKDRFFGCEFVKCIANFQCRLCDMKIQNASEVLPHIDSRVHRNKYQMHLKRESTYESKQKEQNKELGEILQEHEGQPVLLSESSTKTVEEDDGQGKTLLDEIDTILVRVPEILNPPPKEEVKEEAPVEKDETATEKVADGEEETMETKVNEEPAETNDSVTATSEEEEDPVEQEAATEQNDAKETTEEPTNETEEQENVADKLTEKKDDSEVTTPDAKPKKSILKKGTAARGRGGTARRGTSKRSRGAKASPKTRTKAEVEDPTPTLDPTPEVDEEKNESIGDGSFMDGFQVVDEVQDE